MADRFIVVPITMFDVIDTESIAPGDEPDHPHGRIVLNTRSEEEARRVCDEHNDHFGEGA
jgi:hypothetical protein